MVVLSKLTRDEIVSKPQTTNCRLRPSSAFWYGLAARVGLENERFCVMGRPTVSHSVAHA